MKNEIIDLLDKIKENVIKLDDELHEDFMYDIIEKLQFIHEDADKVLVF